MYTTVEHVFYVSLFYVKAVFFVTLSRTKWTFFMVSKLYFTGTSHLREETLVPWGHVKLGVISSIIIAFHLRIGILPEYGCCCKSDYVWFPLGLENLEERDTIYQSGTRKVMKFLW